MTRIEVCGLVIEREGGIDSVPVPLTGVSVEVRIIDLVAEVSIEQRYVNRENNPIEAVYKFPLDEGAGVCRFTAEVDGRLIEGVVKETEEAKVDYEEAMRTGHTAFLVEEKLPDVFKAKVGNLAPGAGAKIRLTYITELKVEGGEIRFYLPTTIAPRYVPANDNSSVAADLSSINTAESLFQLAFEAKIMMGSTIQEIHSPTHKITTTLNSANLCYGSVRLEESVTSLDRDLVLLIKVAEPNKPRLIQEKSKNGTCALMLSLVPSFKLAEQKTELIFVVDRSGSMQGQKIQQAKQALTLFLHSLPIDCYVNIVGFGSTHMSLFPNSRKYDDEVLTMTKAHADSLDANMGGTEIYHPLKWILEQPVIDGYLRQVFLLTDGEVSNVDQVITLVRQQCGKARVFALGLGSSASHHLVEGIARAGNGTALFASLEERLEKKVMQQLQDALQPSLTDVKVHWEGYEEKEKAIEAPIQTEKTLLGFGKPIPESQMTPVADELKLRQIPCDSNIPPVFDGRHFVVYALLKEGAAIPQSVNLVANSPAGPLSVRIPLNSSNDLETSQTIHTFAAKKLIQQLQDKDENGSLKKEIIQLGCQYGLASRYTSFVAVDPKANKQLEESWMMMKSRDIPVQVAHGWHGGFAAPRMMMRCAAPPLSPGIAYSMAMPMSNMVPIALGGAGPQPFASMERVSRSVAPMAKSMNRSLMSEASSTQITSMSLTGHGDEDMECTDAGYDDGGMAVCDSIGGHFVMEPMAPAAPLPLTNDEKLIKLVQSQSFNGAFKTDSNIAQLLETTLDDLKEAGMKNSCSEQVWMTLVALAYLNIVLSELRPSWVLVANKAEKWLATQKLPDETAARTAAQEFIKAKLNL